jgi:putative ABC transport system permease protein
MLEAFMIIGFGAFIGFILAVLVIKIFAILPLQSFKEVAGTPYLNVWVATMSALLLFIIGFFAGFFPARRAAKLNVVDCLRF